MEKCSAHIGNEDYKTILKSSNNEIIVDEPIELGGKGLGPTPLELLAGALGACTAITLKMYAKRKEWSIENIDVDVEFERDISSGITSFERKITISGDVDETQKERMLTIANSCPVHKVLGGECKIHSFLA